MIDPALATVLVALITMLSGIVLMVLKWLLDRTSKATEEQVVEKVRKATETAATHADESAKQLGGDVGDIVSKGIAAGIDGVIRRLESVEGEVRTLRGDLVPVAVADRGIVIDMVAEGLVDPTRVVMIPGTVSPLYPLHLRTIPVPKETS